MRRLTGCLIAMMAIACAANVAAQESEETPTPAPSDEQAAETPESAPEAGEGQSEGNEGGEDSAAPEGETASPDASSGETETPSTPPVQAPTGETSAPTATATETAADPETRDGVTEVQPTLESDAAPSNQVTDSARAGETVVVPSLLDETSEEDESEEGQAPSAAADAPAESESSSRERQGGEQTWSNALPFRGTRLVYENIFNTYQLARDNEQTYNPYYAMSLSIMPRWYFTDAFSARLRFDIEGELTNADDTSEYHEVRVGDLILDLVYNPIVTIPGVEIDLGLGVRFMFPTSLQSQAETRYLALGPDLRLSRVFDILDGLLFGYTFRYTKYLNRYTTMERAVNPYEQFCNMDQPDCLAFSQTGDMTRNHGFSNTLMVSLDFLSERFRPMSLAFMVSFINTLVHDPSPGSVELIGGEEDDVPLSADRQQHRAAVWYILELSIAITDYLSAAVGTSTLNPQLRPDSTYREPLFNRYTNVYVDVTLDLERLVAAVRR